MTEAFTEFDCAMMRRALGLAHKGWMHTSPNPMVGAVVVHGRSIVGEGWHRRFGGPHAEVEALAAARGNARDATMYVTLEPCSHRGKTPPCADAIIAAAVTEVVAAMRDPFPEVSGKGLARLRNAGVTVREGLLEADARALNAAYLMRVEQGRPLFLAKYAMSADGKVATRTGDSKYVTGEDARTFVHQVRSASDGILVGVGAVLADDPLLDARLVAGGRRPVAIVLDSACRTPVDGKLVGRGKDAIIATTSRADDARRRALEDAGCEVVALDGADGRVDLAALARFLGERPMNQVLVEGGPTVHAAFFEAGLVDALHVFIAPLIVGGLDAPSPVAAPGVTLMKDARRLGTPRVRTFGNDVLLAFG